jgi:hypothetical protein
MVAVAISNNDLLLFLFFPGAANASNNIFHGHLMPAKFPHPLLLVPRILEESGFKLIPHTDLFSVRVEQF